MDVPPIPGSGRNRIYQVIIWAAFVVLCFALYGLQVWAQKHSDTQPTANVSVEVLVAAKAVVGVQQFPGVQQQHLDKALKDAEFLSRTMLDRIALLPVRAEVQGREAALEKSRGIEIDEGTTAEQLLTLVQEIYSKETVVSKADQTFITKHLGWNGKLLLCHAESPDVDCDRIKAAAFRTAIVNIATLFVGGGAALIGLVALIVGIVVWKTGSLKLRYAGSTAESPSYRVAYAEMAILALVVLMLAPSIFAILPAPLPLLSLLVVLASFTYLRVRGEPMARIRQALGWHLGKGLFHELGAGVVGYLAGLPVIVLGFIVSKLLATAFDIRPQHPIVNYFRDGNPILLVTAFLFATVWAPVAEESVFRGTLFHGLRSHFGPIITGLLTGLAFAVVHPQGWTTIPVLGSIGFVLAMIREWRGSLIASMVAHAVHNGIVMAIAAMTIMG